MAHRPLSVALCLLVSVIFLASSINAHSADPHDHQSGRKPSPFPSRGRSPSPKPPARLRVRKEFRSLSARELQLYLQGLSTMLSVPTEAGQKLYGRKYKEYLYFVNKHAVTANDPRGDQGHNGACFMTFHRAFMIEFENAIRSVVPELRAIPYWDMSLDTRGGKYKITDPDYFFSPKWAGALGSAPSAANNSYSVVDGMLGGLRVSPYPWYKFKSTAHIFNGSATTGLMRSSSDANTNPYLTRYPAANVRVSFKTNNITFMRDNMFVTDPKPNEYEVNFNETHFLECLNIKTVKSWMDWTKCIDMVDTDTLSKAATVSSCHMLHPSAHLFIGGISATSASSDFKDTDTSPNEAFIFMPHHANVDRSLMIWQRRAARAKPSMATRSVLWGYPVKAPAEFTWTGCFANDVVTLNAGGFTDIFPVPPADKRGYTHAEVLWHTRPGAVDYTYDKMYDVA